MGDEAVAWFYGPIPTDLPPLGPLRQKTEARETIRMWTDPKWMIFSGALKSLRESKTPFEFASKEGGFFSFSGELTGCHHYSHFTDRSLIVEAKRRLIELASESGEQHDDNVGPIGAFEFPSSLHAMLEPAEADRFGRELFERLGQVPLGEAFSRAFPAPDRLRVLEERDFEAMKEAPTKDVPQHWIAQDVAGLMRLASCATRPPRPEGVRFMVRFGLIENPPCEFSAQWMDWEVAQKVFQTRSEETLSKIANEMALGKVKVRPPTHECILELLELKGRKSRMLVVTDFQELTALDFLLDPLGLVPPRDRSETDWIRPLAPQESAAILGRLRALNELPIEEFERQADAFMKEFDGSEGAGSAATELLDDLFGGAIEKFYSKASKKNEPVTLMACKDMWGEKKSKG